MSKTRARNVLAAYYCFPIGSPETLKQQAFSSLGPCSPLVSSFAFLPGVFVVHSFPATHHPSVCALCALAGQWGSRGNPDGRQTVTTIKASAVCGAISTWDPHSEQTGRL